jgi:hypothetical protein
LVKVKKKIATQMLAFSKLAASAWGISVLRARQVYAVVICSVLAYGAFNWHKIGKNLKNLSKALIPTQNKCLQIMSGAYKAIPTRYLESEMAMPLLNLYLDKWVADFESRIAVSGMAQLLRQMGARAAQMAAGSRRRKRREQAKQPLRNSKARAAANWVGGNKDTENTILRK